MGKDIESRIFRKDVSSPLVRKDRNKQITVKDLQDWTDECIRYIDSKFMPLEKIVEEIRSFAIQLQSVNMNDYSLYTQFVDMYRKFQFPIECNEDFKSFDVELGSDHDNLKTNLKKCLKISIDRKKAISYNVKIIIKKFFKSSVLNLYTTQRKRGSKELFNQTEFYKCLYDCIFAAYRGDKKVTISEILVLSCLGEVFNLAKDWEVPRKRKQPDDDKQLESEDFNEYSQSSEEAASII